jgi:LuxR family maltose regulon positive regulatory protein
MREASPMPGEKNSGVTLSRTLIPTLPNGYLSRRHLFSKIDNESGGTTFVIAPQGYGKTTLVSEWAQNQKKGVIWLTVANGDTTNEMSAMLIAATRRVLPEFAPWFEKDQLLRATDVVRRWGNDLLETGREFVFVLDNLRSSENEDVDIAIKLIEQFPSNIHFIAIRSNEIEGIYGICSSRGQIKVLTPQDLRFTDEETHLYASNLALEINAEVEELLSAGGGWPAAIALLVAHLQVNGTKSDLEKIMSSSVEPLRALVMLVVNGLDQEIVELCERLSILEVFTLEQAELLLEDKFNYDLISSIAHKGEIFTSLRNPGDGFAFSPMVRQVFLEKLRSQGALKSKLHRTMMNYFESRGDAGSAIDHAFQVGDESKISELFPDAARIKQAKGMGGDLMRWAPMAGMSPVDGEAKKSTVLITGLLADLDFSAAQSEISRLQLLAESAQSDGAKEFFLQFVAASQCYSLLSLGNFPALEETMKRTKVGSAECYLGPDDQINLLRLLATKRYLWNEADGVEETYFLARELGKQTSLATSHTFLLAIQSMYLHQRGEYRRAHELASVALDQYQRNRFVGNHGPLDVMYVIARCLLEFSRPQEALSIFDNIRNIAYQWKQWHWYFASDGHIMEFMTFNGKAREALERIKIARNFLATFDSTNQLEIFVDLGEMNIRRSLKDFDRLEKLVNRAPSIRYVHHFKMAVDEFRGRKSVIDEAKKLPEKTPRDLIWKYLNEVSFNIDKENIALPAMRNALEVGSQVGAKETFLRQRDEMGNLIIRIANEFPTVYNEEIAAAMADRMKERGSNMNEGQTSLTKRELEILRQLSTGRTLTVIAGELHISQNTMKTHLKNLYKKMGAESRHDAVEKAKATFLI